MSRLKSLGALVVAPLTCLLVLACDTGQESSVTAPSPSFTVVGNPVVASASGSGHFEIGGALRTFSFTAQRQYDGTVHGRFQLNAFGGARFQGTVTCITVEGDGKTARIGGIGGSFVNGQFSDTFVNNFRMIGKGPGNNFLVLATTHLTFYANGDLTADVYIDSCDCK